METVSFLVFMECHFQSNLNFHWNSRITIIIHCVKSFQIRSFFWSVFSCIRTEYGYLLRKSLYLVRIQKSTDQKKLRIWTIFKQWYYDSPRLYCYYFNCQISYYHSINSYYGSPMWLSFFKFYYHSQTNYLFFIYWNKILILKNFIIILLSLPLWEPMAIVNG